MYESDDGSCFFSTFIKFSAFSIYKFIYISFIPRVFELYMIFCFVLCFSERFQA